MSSTETVVARQGEAACLQLAARDMLRIEQTTGGQCADLLAWGRGAGGERFSAAITRSREGGSPGIGASLWSAWPYERPLLEIIADTAPGHDLLHPACTPGEYTGIGAHGRPSCVDVQATAAARWEIRPDQLPDPFNLWFTATLASNGEIGWRPTETTAGDRVELRACIDCLVIVNPCVDDLFGCSTVPGGSIRVTHCPVLPPTESIHVAGSPVEVASLAISPRSTEAAFLETLPDDVARANAVRRGALRYALRSAGLRGGAQRSVDA
jgi:uncharacterized protein YcgI (DUF1989 family)